MSEETAQALHEAGLRVTRQRLAVLDLLDRRPHTSVDEIVRELSNQFSVLSAQTVYGVLTALERADLVRRVELPGSSWRYEIQLHNNHHHVVCRVCGRVEDVDCVVGSAPCLVPPDTRGFVVEAADVVFRGVCADCAGVTLA